MNKDLFTIFVFLFPFTGIFGGLFHYIMSLYFLHKSDNIFNPFRIKYKIDGERFIEIINRQKQLSSFDKLLMWIQGHPIPKNI